MQLKSLDYKEREGEAEHTNAVHAGHVAAGGRSASRLASNPPADKQTLTLNPKPKKTLTLNPKP